MSVESLSFSEIVKPEFMIHNLVARDREDALLQMSQFLVEKGYCKPSFVEGILNRELHHPSALPLEGHKIAIPHTDAEHVNESVILFARLAKPVEFISMGSTEDKLQVQMISMFALKEKKLIGNLLETLITVYQHNETLDALLNSKDVREMYTILRDAVERLGK